MREKKKHRNKKFMILGVLVFILVLGVSYAWMHLVLKAEKNVHVSLGAADVVLVEESDKLELTGQIPLPDRIGKQGEEFKFYIENRSLMDVTYEIRLADNEEKHADCEECKYLEEKDIRYELKRTGLDKTETLTADRKIDEGKLKKGKKIEYTLKIWINKDAVKEDIEQAVFYGKLALKATQIPGSENIIEATPDGSGANVPELGTTMIPVVYNEQKTSWEVADVKTTKEWFDYEQQKWANAVVVTPKTKSTYRSAKAGTEVSMDDILQMYVWIPRYSYAIKKDTGSSGYYGEGGTSTSSPGEITVQFVDTSIQNTGDAKYEGDAPTDEDWYTPDGFTLGSQALSGLWVGKFETGREKIIKPNVYSWRSITVSNIYNTAKGIVDAKDTFGLDNTTYDSHAMKNSEWGAVAYLSQSKYGKYGNEDYQGANKEVYINNNSDDMTGCSGEKPGASRSTTCTPYNNLESAGDGMGQKGPGASTTGTIYGAYDMSGGSWEYVMGNLGQDSKRAEFSGTWATDNADYFNFYTSPSTSTDDQFKSHAIGETENWYGDYHNMVNSTNPWFIHGGGYSNTDIAGVFCYGRNTGYASDSYSFRVVLTLKQ